MVSLNSLVIFMHTQIYSLLTSIEFLLGIFQHQALELNANKMECKKTKTE